MHLSFRGKKTKQIIFTTNSLISLYHFIVCFLNDYCFPLTTHIKAPECENIHKYGMSIIIR